MASNSSIFPHAWRLALRGVRVALAATCLAAQVISPHRHLPTTALAAVYAALSVAALFRKRPAGSRTALVGLLAETVFFLIFASYGEDREMWLSSSLYLFLLMTSIVRHGWTDTFAVVGVSAVYIGLAPAPAGGALGRLILFAGILACMLAYQKRRLERLLAQAQLREAALKEEVASARDGERQRIAADFHDGPLQVFIGFELRLGVLRTLLQRDLNMGLEDLKEMQEIARAQVREIRAFLRNMRPAEAEGADLMAWMSRVVEEFQKDTGVPSRFSSSEPEVSAPPELSRELVQILREALHNVQKHARANRVAVTLERSGSSVEIAVEDNGAGFAFSGTYTLEELEVLRLGPQSIKRRVRGLGGDLQLESRPGRGASLRMRVPVANAVSFT